MEHYASLTAIDLMEAYYKVAMKTFIDDVSVLAVEECLLQKLPSIFSSDDICDLSDEEVQRLATESLDITKERNRMASKREILEEGQRQLARLNTGSLLVE